ncbi:MAG: dTMP kinase [Candidatus Thermoplasmatota archaeon]|nr:dTMP kinase [Candidatus Thermoplasmatota archaeon]
MFVALEGIDGSGKTTVSSRLREKLESDGIKVFLTHEPTFSVDSIAGKLVSQRDAESALKLFFMFTEDRYRHQAEISEKLDQGYLVLCDRYIYSSFAYQGSLLEGIFGTPERVVTWMSGVSEIIKIRPDLNVYLDISADTAIKRIWNRRNITGFEDLQYLDRVRSYYTGVLRKHLVIMNGEDSIERIVDAIYRIIRQ